MIPSDHFVRFYNEVFKFLESRGDADLQEYWLCISRHQEKELLPLFTEEGFPGMKAYYDRIIHEENLDAECEAHDDFFEFRMRGCASLRKAKDNDAGLMPRYCDHCPGWINPLMKKLGYYPVFDLESREEPHCHFLVFRNAADAEKYATRGNIVVR